MSRQNKVNPGMYTQRGRLTQDDAARELARQRSIGAQQVWQHDSKNAMPWPTNTVPGASVPDAGEDETEVAAPSKPVNSTKKKAARVTAKPAAAKAAKTAKSPVKAKRKTGRTTAVTPKAAKAARPQAKSGRKAVLARTAAGPATTPRRSAKRRRS